LADLELSEHGFSRIRKLPEDRLTHVNNWLARGGEVMALARFCQQEWKIWTDVNERTLMQQLNRYKKWVLVQKDPSLPEMRTSDGALVVKATRQRNVDVMERLAALLDIQEKRIQVFLNQEAKLGMPLQGVDKVIDSTKQLLLDMQKIRFDLGMDEYVAPPMPLLKGAVQRVTNSDGSSTTNMLFEAVAMADQALSRAMIPENLDSLGRNPDAKAGA
jgi:plasmid maintenance system antidote protein VapI